MSDIITSSTHKLPAIPQDILADITKLHKEVSGLKTPKAVIKPDFSGNDYVELWYMKKIADEKYPGWSWIIDSNEFLYQNVPVEYTKKISIPVNDPETGVPTIRLQTETGTNLVNIIKYHIVRGTLIWHEFGVWRKGSMVAGHRVQLLEDKRDYVNVGNDVKSSNTDCLKKALNTYLNICDDVYKNEDKVLTEEMIDEMLTLAKKAGMDVKEIQFYVDSGKINAYNYDKKLANLKSKIEAKSQGK